jgi:hypothetical protein
MRAVAKQLDHPLELASGAWLQSLDSAEVSTDVRIPAGASTKPIAQGWTSSRGEGSRHGSPVPNQVYDAPRAVLRSGIRSRRGIILTHKLLAYELRPTLGLPDERGRT